MTAAQENYWTRMRRVLAYVDAHLDDELDLAVLSHVAVFSKFHFHRQFSATFGLSVHRYVQLARLKRASQTLAWDDTQTITAIAMDAGYDTPDAFARAFRQRLAQSPSSFRKSPDWPSWLSAFGPLDNARGKAMQIIFERDDVTILDVPDMPVAIMEHRGSRAKIKETSERFRAWCEASGLSVGSGRSSFMVFRSEREPAVPEDYSVDLCVSTDRSISREDEWMKAGTIPGGRCAVLRYPGNTNNLEPAALYLYRDWLPESGEELRDFPIYARRQLVPIADIRAHEVVVDLYLPLK
ncbi:AraC family transcriptional regulator [Mesorhizobium sp. B2-4-6]|uniref:AraC family transcriptional regulator n=1 Tax=Mesorhizobium sp. B2-4-6 TaxID=2589943 RepID=UPI00112D01B7|nr:AraC family transcriptional regulator [Mesorhizobium sp. B2-4-6]TPL46446.1 helix-turn-helix domain-containing protein [Mesorhizobium sp. B2-4-6]